MNKTNQITICRSEYDTQEDFENAIKKAIMVLLDNNYIMTVRYDEKGLKIVAIDYNTSRQDWAMTILIGLVLKKLKKRYVQMMKKKVRTNYEIYGI